MQVFYRLNVMYLYVDLTGYRHSMEYIWNMSSLILVKFIAKSLIRMDFHPCDDHKQQNKLCTSEHDTHHTRRLLEVSFYHWIIYFFVPSLVWVRLPNSWRNGLVWRCIYPCGPRHRTSSYRYSRVDVCDDRFGHLCTCEGEGEGEGVGVCINTHIGLLVGVVLPVTRLRPRDFGAKSGVASTNSSWFNRLWITVELVNEHLRTVGVTGVTVSYVYQDEGRH